VACIIIINYNERGGNSNNCRRSIKKKTIANMCKKNHVPTNTINRVDIVMIVLRNNFQVFPSRLLTRSNVKVFL